MASSSSSSSSSSFSSSSFSSCSSSMSSSSSSSFSSSPSCSSALGVPNEIPDYLIARGTAAAVNIGKGGSWPTVRPYNILGGVAPQAYTTRTGIGVGRDYTGTPLIYSSSSHSASFSSSSFSSCSSSFSSSSFSSSSFSSSSSSSDENFSSSSSCSSSHSSSFSSSCSSSSRSRDAADTNGAVFITDVSATGVGNVGDKTYEDGYTLTGFSTDTDLITVEVLAFTGYSHYVPRLSINGNDIDPSDLSLNSQGHWVGSIAIDLNGASELSAEHEDNPEPYTVPVTVAAGAQVTDLQFTDGYPGSQTELKEGDTFNITFTTDVACDRVEVVNYQAAQAQTTSLTPGTSHTVAITISDRGSGTIAEQTVRIRCRAESNNFWGDYVVATDFHTGDASGTVELNNDYPVISSISQGNIDYPASQEAIKDSESVTVNHTISFPTGTGTVAYDSPNSQLSIANSSTYEPAKSATRIAGNYNISINNFRVVATKTTNAASTTRQAVVYIAHSDQVINISTPYTRLRSSNAGESYSITIASSQRLIEAPTLDDLGAGEGTWQGAGFTGGPSNWTRSMLVADSDTKGTFTFTNLSSTNLAGKVVTVINSGADYVLGGFTQRTLTVAAWPNREASIGTQVYDTSKLVCENLSKGGGGPNGGTIFTYSTDTTNEVDKFTITEPTGVANPTGNLWFNKDQANAVSNTSGEAAVILEETV